MRFPFRALFGAVGISLALWGGGALADAPMAKTQAPGYYRLMLGDFEITALSDGTVRLPMLKLLTNTSPATVSAALKKGFLKEMVETSVNAYLVNTGPRLVLIDTGAANLFGPTLGKLLNNLQAAGYKPEQVDEIYITHMHPDHVGGLMAASSRTFPNAILRIEKADTDYWLSDAERKAAPDAAIGFFQGAMASVNPYLSAGKLQTFSGKTELLPGIRTLPSPGHTPGHTAYLIESQGQKLALWGDLVHVAALQFANPTVTIQFDTNSAQALKSRERAFADAARQGYVIGLAHAAFPGLGRLRVADGGHGYTWVPLNYSSLQ